MARDETWEKQKSRNRKGTELLRQAVGRTEAGRERWRKAWCSDHISLPFVLKPAVNLWFVFAVLVLLSTVTSCLSCAQCS